MTGRLRVFGVFALGLAVFAASLAGILIGLTSPRDVYFDETWYVPAGRALLATGEMLRQEHPPLGKLLIALSMAIFGDDPLGWRASAAAFGALTIAGVFAWTQAMLRNAALSLYAAVIGFVGAVVYIQARIAMLDIFLMGFGVWAIAFLAFSLRDGATPRGAFLNLSVAGVLVGLTSACKLSGVFLWAGLVFVAMSIALLRRWGARFADPAPSDFYGETVWPGMTVSKGLFALALLPALAYAATYLQQMIHAGSPFEIVASHLRMREIMSGDAGTHPYSSVWWQWPALIRPVWYLFTIPGGDAATWGPEHPAFAVVGLPNPIATVFGEGCVLYLLGRWMSTRDRAAMLVWVAFFSQYLPWMINPKGLEFAFYFFPSLVAVGPAITIALNDVPTRAARLLLMAVVALVCGAAFVFFLPLLNGAIGGVTPEMFDRRIWLPSWR